MEIGISRTKTVVNQRLNESGVCWGCEGTDAVSHLRA